MKEVSASGFNIVVVRGRAGSYWQEGWHSHLDHHFSLFFWVSNGMEEENFSAATILNGDKGKWYWMGKTASPRRAQNWVLVENPITVMFMRYIRLTLGDVVLNAKQLCRDLLLTWQWWGQGWCTLHKALHLEVGGDDVMTSPPTTSRGRF